MQKAFTLGSWSSAELSHKTIVETAWLLGCTDSWCRPSGAGYPGINSFCTSGCAHSQLKHHGQLSAGHACAKWCPHYVCVIWRVLSSEVRSAHWFGTWECVRERMWRVGSGFVGIWCGGKLQGALSLTKCTGSRSIWACRPKITSPKGLWNLGDLVVQSWEVWRDGEMQKVVVHEMQCLVEIGSKQAACKSEYEHEICIGMLIGSNIIFSTY